MAKAVDRVNGIAQVRAALYRGSRKEDVEFGDYLRDLCARLSDGLLINGRLALEVEVQSAHVPVDTAISLAGAPNLYHWR
jgi:two-component sensor histidine kinase